jgi:hypothetical protein
VLGEVLATPHREKISCYEVFTDKSSDLLEHVARTGEGRAVYRVLVGKPKGRRPLGRPRRRWVDNIKMVIQEVGCVGYGLD